MRIINLAFGLAIVILCGQTTTQAAVSTFTDEATWQALVTNRTSIDFDSFTGPVSTEFPGVTFTGANGGAPRAEPRAQHSLPNSLTINGSDDNDLIGGVDIHFDSPHSRVGFWYGDSQFPGNIVTLYDSGGSPLATYELLHPHPTLWDFVGFASSDNNISRVLVTLATSDYVPLDDLQYGSVPEPSSAALLIGSGAMLIATWRARRREQRREQTGHPKWRAASRGNGKRISIP